MITTTWTCPACGAPNVDIYALTVMPVCEDCGAAWDWNQIAPAPVLFSLARLFALLDPDASCRCPACVALVVWGVAS